MGRGDEDRLETDGIGPEAGGDVIERDVFAPDLLRRAVRSAGGPVVLDEGVVAWT